MQQRTRQAGDVPSTPALQQRIARICIDRRFPAPPASLPARRCAARDRIRIGYFSSDFGDHPVSYLTAGLFEHHDRSRFEVFGFSFGSPCADPMQQRLRKAFDRYVECRGLSDEAVARQAHEMELDVAVNLNGHTAGARTGAFALRMAPLQVNYLGYPGTMGADYIDYIVADATVIPPALRPWYTEQVACLPHAFQANDDTKALASRPLDRGELGLPKGGFVFCCFNNSCKITPDVFAAWMRLLSRVPGSVLWLQADTPALVRNLGRAAAKHGVGPDRLVFAKRRPLAEYLAQYRVADLFLDTWHYNAGTTASDALWAGLPVLSRLGETFAGRMAASLLHAIGLPELIATSGEEYESMALALALDPKRLQAIRERLAENRGTHPLFDTALFTRHLEAAFATMVARARANLPPLSFSVPV